MTAEQVLFIHARVIDESGGTHGVRDAGLLRSAVDRPDATFDGRDLNPDIWHKASALMESLISNPPFLDGNKRTSLAATALFLRRNGSQLVSSQQEIETFTLDMALKNISLVDATAWLKQHAIKPKNKP